MKIIKDRFELWQVLPKGMVIAELGTFVGEYAQKIIDLAQPKELYIVDIFANSAGTQWNVHVDNMSLYFDILTEKYHNNKNVYVVKSTTKDFLETIFENTLDAVYIDADHSYTAVRLDLDLSYLKIKSGGFICGHDYDHQSVKQALDEFLAKTGLELLYLTDEKDTDRSFIIQKNSGEIG